MTRDAGFPRPHFPFDRWIQYILVLYGRTSCMEHTSDATLIANWNISEKFFTHLFFLRLKKIVIWERISLRCFHHTFGIRQLWHTITHNHIFGKASRPLSHERILLVFDGIWPTKNLNEIEWKKAKKVSNKRSRSFFVFFCLFNWIERNSFQLSLLIIFPPFSLLFYVLRFGCCSALFGLWSVSFGRSLAPHSVFEFAKFSHQFHWVKKHTHNCQPVTNATKHLTLNLHITFSF